jgi:hypothetical protein
VRIRLDGGAATLVLPLVVVSIAALLRLDAITQSYGPVEHPAWLRAVQIGLGPALDTMRPPSVSWKRVGLYPHRDAPPSQYISDPYTYLIFAREMRSFSGAHHREPVFPFATRAWLWLLNGQDVAVSFASASFSVLAVLATYLLGLAIYSRWVGFGAALAMAVDYDAISWSVGGWRDDAFTFGVVITAWAMVRFLQRPSWGTAVLMGLCGGFTALVRLTAVTFLIPGFAYLALAADGLLRARLARVLAAILVLFVVTAPYLVNCWRVFGDPLYAINHLTADQLVMEGQQAGSPAAAPASSSMNVVEYLTSKTGGHPYRTLDTVLLGLTSYPFSNKWSGLSRWIPRLGDVLSWAALAGLLVLGASAPGRLVLLVLVASLLPAAVTWKLAADWRFTAHAYPFFLVAAFLAFGKVLELLKAFRAREQRTLAGPRFRQVASWTALIVCIAAGTWFVRRVLPFLVVAESLRAQEEVTIGTDGRDGLFFRDGWAAPERGGNVTLRAATGPMSSIELPLPAADYRLAVRLDPYPRPHDGVDGRLPAVRMFLNNNLLSTFELGWNPERVGSYVARVPRTAVQNGANRLTFMSNPPPDTQSGSPRHSFAIWYVRIHPEGALK